MLIEELELSEKKTNQLKKKKLNTVEDIIYMFPKKYMDYRQAKSVDEAISGKKTIMICTVMDVKRGNKYIEVVGRECKSFRRVSIKWFSQPYKYSEVINLKGIDVAVGGLFNNDDYGPSFVNPEIFTTDIPSAFKITPIYSKIAGMSNEYFLNVLNKSLNLIDIKDDLSENFRNYFNLITEREMVIKYHYPCSIDDIKLANKKIVYNRLYKLAKKMILDAGNVEKKSTYCPRILTNTNKLINELPYSLTDDQKIVVSEFVSNAQNGERVNALIQGDVGCGKTVCSFLIMFAMADNGYQSALMVPTGILAKQHFKELQFYAEKFGYKTVYLGGDLTVKEKKLALNMIKSGEATFVVGTHSIISDDVEFKNLGLTVVDEEHKFGVIQRETLKKKANDGVHSISMSATPIPRSLALTLYGEGMDIYTISTMPGGRVPVKTAVVNNDNSIFSFVQMEIENGHQCYIVCPLIDNNEDNENVPESVEDVYKKVTDYFSIHNKNIKASMITGKMKDNEKNQIIDDFSKNNTQILIATTIIEVGVNVPNATVITIMNAERFGLAGLHQLRGRVGRSNLQSYCMLKSLEKNNDRLEIMCMYTDGFKIAEEDLKLRGIGDLAGVKQSGDDESVSLMLKYPQIYEEIKNYIKEKEVFFNDSLKL